MSSRPENQMFTVMRQHGITSRPTYSGNYEAIFLEEGADVLAAHRILQDADIIVELNFAYGIPMFINRSRKTG